jgi:hypothetical protein
MSGIHAPDPPLERVVARAIFQALRSQLAWDLAEERTRAVRIEAARNAVGMLRFVDGLRAGGGRLEGDPEPESA